MLGYFKKKKEETIRKERVQFVKRNMHPFMKQNSFKKIKLEDGNILWIHRRFFHTNARLTDPSMKKIQWSISF